MMKDNDDLKILIIDDNPAIHQDFIKILTAPFAVNELDILDTKLFGDTNINTTISLPTFKINAASQGKEGVELIEKALKEGHPYALAFVDIRMPPGWDGIETIKHIWNLDPDIQIVICTAFSDYTWEETIENLGTRDNLLILKKPFDNVAVRQLACALTKKWQLMSATKEHEQFLEEKIEQRTQALQESLSLSRATMESSADGIIVVTNEGKIIDYNLHFLSLLGIPESVIQTKDNKILLDYIVAQLKEPELFFRLISNINENPKDVSIDVIYFKNGRVFERYSQPHKLNGEIIGRVWSFRDITKKHYLEKKLEYQVSHDALTGLPNRILLYDRIKHGIEIVTRNKSKMGIFFLDLDRFKLINDSLGHQAGDKLLIEVSNRLKSSLRSGDSLARLSGDEFIVVAYNLSNTEASFAIAKKLLATFKAPFLIENRELNITSSIGISIFPEDGKKAEELLKNADMAMYHAKEKGKNNFKFYRKIMNKNSLGILEIETELRNALLNKELYLTYQAQINAVTEKIIGMEVLIRWAHPKKGIILPMDFIPQAEVSGLIIPIGEWVLKTACKQCKAWQDQGLDPIRISVNVAAQQLRHISFVDTIKSILEETGLLPEFLELEVTENVMLSSVEMVQVIQDIRKLGIKVALDDFGTGNSSLSYLRQTVVDRLKIGKSFISNISISENNTDKVIIKSIVAMAHSLGLDVIAEGVETEKELDFLQKEECNDIQGFYFSLPLEAPAFEALLKRRNQSAS